MWGRTADGHASDQTVNNTIVSEIAQRMATHGVAPGASIAIAEAALVPEENLAALGDTLFLSRLPATDNECSRRIAAAVAQAVWEEIGLLAPTKPTQNRPGTFYQAYEDEVTLYGTPYRAVVLPSRTQDKRRHKQLERAIQASSVALQAAVHPAAQQTYCCQADAEAAAAKGRALQTEYHGVDVPVEERPQ
jgi:hypothetical protein